MRVLLFLLMLVAVAVSIPKDKVTTKSVLKVGY